MQEHELHKYFRNYSRQLAADYEAIRPRISEDPGTAGDQGEASWAKLLEDWLPEGYSVVTKGRILGATGEASPQIDIVILKPNYPKFLKKEKYYLMGGVAAAFECKTTLRPQHLDKIMHTAKSIAALQIKNSDSIKSEIFSPIIYGVLAHTHSWPGEPEEIIQKIRDRILLKAKETADQPRELPEIFCVADLAGWRLAHIPKSFALLSKYQMPDLATRQRSIEALKQQLKEFPIIAEHHDNDYSQIWFERPHSTYSTLYTSRIRNDGTPNPLAERYTSVGSFIACLYDKLAYRDSSLLNITRYFSAVHIPSSSAGINTLASDLVWSRNVISDTNWARWRKIGGSEDWRDVYF